MRYNIHEDVNVMVKLFFLDGRKVSDLEVMKYYKSFIQDPVDVTEVSNLDKYPYNKVFGLVLPNGECWYLSVASPKVAEPEVNELFFFEVENVDELYLSLAHAMEDLEVEV